ncbi:MAG: anti-sigma factor family protein, partial [Candidatus Polarisedimenticolia bacterium]
DGGVMSDRVPILGRWRCRRHRRLLWEVLDGTAPPAARAALDLHMKGCPRCAAALEVARALHRALVAQPPEEPSERFDERLILRLTAGFAAAPGRSAAPRAAAEVRDPLREREDGDPMTRFDWVLLWGMVGFSVLAIGFVLYLVLPAVAGSPAAGESAAAPGVGRFLSWGVQAPVAAIGGAARDLLRHPLAAPMLLASGLLAVTLGWVRLVLARPAH